MLSWSNNGYKFTIGLGCLAIAAMLSELGGNDLPFWVVLMVALPPLVLFLFAHPSELPPRVVWAAHVMASVWYVTVAIGLLASLDWVDPLPRGWPVYPLFASVGFIPSGIVLYRAARGVYHPLPRRDNGKDAESPTGPDQGDN
jgi:hypothetical protein